MNIHRVPEYLLRWSVTLFGILLSIMMVRMVGAGNLGKVILILTGIGLMTLILWLKERIWVVLPMTWMLTGQVQELGIPLTVRDILIFSVFGAYLILKAFKVVTRSPEWDWLAVMAVVMVVYTAICWIRNPVGVQALDSERVGGRPYFTVFTAVLAGWVLRYASLAPSSATRMTLGLVGMQMLEGFFALIIYVIPATGAIFDRFYRFSMQSWAEDQNQLLADPGSEGNVRYGYLSLFGYPLSIFMIALVRPLALLNPLKLWRPVLTAVGLFLILLSGYRSIFVGVVGTAFIVGFYWRGAIEVVKMTFLGVALLALVIMGQNRLYSLPYPVQRALSFLPGDWDPIAIADAAGSTSWRVEMWKQMLFTNRFIENHVWGDGFGFRKRDLEIMQYISEHGTFQEAQENYMRSGMVHSGPVSAVRYAGYVGLALILTLLIGISVRAWKLMVRARGGPYQLLALYVCAPMVVEPFYFTVLYGAYEEALPRCLFAVGMLRMLENSLDDHPAIEAEPQAALAESPLEAREAESGVLV